MAKQLLFDVEARAHLKRGVDRVADAVKITIGPKGRNVVLDKKFGSPTITNDGVTIAKEIELEEPFENMGAQLVKEVASKTNDIAGDGTTTATVLAQALIAAGLQNVAAGANPIQLKKGIELGVEAIVKAIKEQSIPISEREKIAQVASISAADPTIGETVADAMEKVGKDGVITVEESKGLETELELVEGMQFDKGYISAYMVTNAQRMEAVLEDPYILITDKKISAIADLLPILEKVVQSGKPLLVIAEDVEGDWGHGGETNLDNLVLLCHRHHWSVHEGGWQLVRAEHGRVLAVPPSHTYQSWTRAPDGSLRSSRVDAVTEGAGSWCDIADYPSAHARRHQHAAFQGFGRPSPIRAR